VSQAYGKTFAQVYNERWTGFAAFAAPRIEALLQSGAAYGRLPKSLLDICCGTGQLAGYFLARGYTVHGIDLSPHMLAIARENNRTHVSSGAASFSVQDARDFGLPAPVSYAVCLFDSMNHLDSIESVESCCRHAHDALASGGLFVFDVNTEKGLRRWNGLSVTEDEDIFMLNRGLYEEGMARAYTRITGFLRGDDGRYERFSQTAYNTVFPVERVLAALTAAGFPDPYCAGSDDLTVPVADPESLGRVYIVSRRP
jgi:SAM-dependent methyltransferase